MKLSVIVPVYKAESTLRQCVDSLLRQGLEDYEILLINDGSPDRSQAIIDEYRTRYPDTVRSLLLENGGQGRARNRGIEMARGDWLAFADSDDWVEDLAYQRMLNLAEEQGADLVVCDFERFFPDGSTESYSSWDEERPIAAAGSSCDKLFRRSMVGEIRFPEGLWYEDFAFSLMALERSKKTVHLAEPLYHYRSGMPSTMNNNNSQKNLDLLKILDLIRQFMEKEGCDEEDFRYLLLNHVLLEGIKRVSSQSGPEKREILAAMRSYVREQIPKLGECVSFRQTPRNRRLIMGLNYLGLEELSRLILNVNKKLK